MATSRHGLSLTVSVQVLVVPSSVDATATSPKLPRNWGTSNGAAANWRWVMRLPGVFDRMRMFRVFRLWVVTVRIAVTLGTGPLIVLRVAGVRRKAVGWVVGMVQMNVPSAPWEIVIGPQAWLPAPTRAETRRGGVGGDGG